MSAQVTEAHRALATELCRNATGSNRALHHVPKFAQAIADSEARALAQSHAQFAEVTRVLHEVIAERDTLRAECERLRKDAVDYTQWIACKMLQPEWDSFKNSLEVIDHRKQRAEKAEAAQLDAVASCDLAIARAERAEAEAKRGHITLVAVNERASDLAKSLDEAEAELASAKSELESIKRGHGELGRYERLRLKNAELIAELAKERARLQAVVNSCWSVHKGNENMFAVFCRTQGGYITPWVATDRAAIDQAMQEKSK